jgi:2-C-methyl-D-erythritol 4-phosphate cytidylyltransferase
VHDGVRPLVDASVLSDVIVVGKKYGNAVSSMPYNEQIFKKCDDISTCEYIPRETLRRVSTPQAYRFGKLLWAYQKAFSEGIGIYGSAYTNTMMVDLGEKLYFAAGSEKNIKLTTKEDLDTFKAFLKVGRYEMD